MYPQANSRFPHRFNQDGSYDSICPMCLVTVVTVRNEAELDRHEQAHDCDPIRLYQFDKNQIHSNSTDFLR